MINETEFDIRNHPNINLLRYFRLLLIINMLNLRDKVTTAAVPRKTESAMPVSLSLLCYHGCAYYYQPCFDESGLIIAPEHCTLEVNERIIRLIKKCAYCAIVAVLIYKKRSTSGTYKQ